MVAKNTSLVTEISTDIFYTETDGMPLPDGEYQLRHFLYLVAILKHFFRDCADVWASGNTFMYYEEGNPRVSVSPDCYVAFGVDTDLILSNNNYRVWDMGKAPDFVLEIGSPSTWRQDLGPKRDLYARLGIGEYWKFDPSGGDHYGEPLVGERLVDGEYRRMEINREPDGGEWGYSPTLNLELHWIDGRLRLYDPEGSRWLQNMEETAEEAARERAARKSAEAQLAEMEAELRRLRAE